MRMKASIEAHFPPGTNSPSDMVPEIAPLGPRSRSSQSSKRPPGARMFTGDAPAAPATSANRSDEMRAVLMTANVGVDRHVAARGRTVHDFQRRVAAPCRNVSESTEMLDRKRSVRLIEPNAK